MSLCTLTRPHAERSGREDQDYFVLRSLVMSLHFLFSVQLARTPCSCFTDGKTEATPQGSLYLRLQFNTRNTSF